MHNNDILRLLSGALGLEVADIAALARLSGAKADESRIERMLLDRSDPDWCKCSDLLMAHLLEGLIIDRRGRDVSGPPRPVDRHISNNMVLKKLRVALQLHDADMYAIFQKGGLSLNKSELSALFRKPDNKRYRPCSDEQLQAFLAGLAAVGKDRIKTEQYPESGAA